MTGTKKWWKKYKKVVVIAGAAMVLVMAGLVIYALRDMPNPEKLKQKEYPESSQIFDRNGRLLYLFYSDKRRISVTLDQIPTNLKNATIAVEDKNFYSNNGFDFAGILRGFVRSVFQGRLQGGSTLTQQLVKNGLLTPERTITRKIKEAILTVAINIIYSKDQILEMYFNQTPYGGTLWGAQTAAQSIFNKDVKDLDLAECALIAGLPASPTQYSPFSHPDLAKKRQEVVLQRMEESGFITRQQHEEAAAEKLNYYVSQNNIQAPHFVFYVKQKLIDTYGEKVVDEGGLKITTTLDLDLQNQTQQIVQTELEKLKKMNVSNGAVVITEPKTGQILAMIGSKDYFANDIDGKFNVATALRQPGSSIKPLNYAVGIETGKVTAASIFDDDPTCFNVEGQKPYCPENYGNKYHGIQTMRNALANSLNIPAVKMLKLNGLDTFVASASAMGLSSLKNASDYGLSLTLGGGEVTMTDMATGFGTLANMGTRQDLHSILSVVDRNGKTIDEYKYVPGDRVISRETSYIIANILSDDGARSMVFGAGSMLNIKKHPEVSVKTGTTNDLRDNWTIGYTPDYVVVVWVGNNNNTKMSGVVSGTTGAAPIWNKVMTYVLRNAQVKKPAMPQDVVGMTVCNLTGQLPPDEGCDSHYEYFKKEYVPTQKVPLKQNVQINKDTGRILTVGETAPNTEWQEHNAVQDVSGVMVCLDCSAIGDTGTPPVTIN